MKRAKKIRKTTIHTGGQHVPGLHFQGEQMTCVICGKQQKSNPAIESNWRCIQADGTNYYACTDEFPADGASSEEFQVAYLKVLIAIARKLKETKSNGKSK